MSTTYRALKFVFRKAVPPKAKSILFNGRTPFSKAVIKIKSKLESSAPHSFVYDAGYYANYSEEMERSAIGMVDCMMSAIKPTSVVDIGCGSGEVLAEFARRGVKAKGADLSDAALEICRKKGLEVARLDLENRKMYLPWYADLVVSTEVAEHIPADLADHYAATLCRISTRAVVITAAPPGQGGTDHVNEQPPEYWIPKFAHFGLKYSAELTKRFQTEWSERNVEWTRARNVLVFLR